MPISGPPSSREMGEGPLYTEPPESIPSPVDARWVKSTMGYMRDMIITLTSEGGLKPAERAEVIRDARRYSEAAKYAPADLRLVPELRTLCGTVIKLAEGPPDATGAPMTPRSLVPRGQELLIEGLTMSVDGAVGESIIGDAHRELAALAELIGLDLDEEQNSNPLSRGAMRILLDGIERRLRTGLAMVDRERDAHTALVASRLVTRH